MFTLNGVRKAYDGQPALAGIDLAIAPGRTTVLVGPSGCGKSTLLGVMCGLVTPDVGEVRFDGRPAVASDRPAIRRRIGYVIQDGGLFPHLTGRANITLMARHLRRPADDIGRRVATLREQTRLTDDILDRLPAEMSGGQRQRVALMRALVLDPDVLLLDEPLGALDPMVRAGLQRDLVTLFRDADKTGAGKTVVMVTHDMGEAALFGDTVVLLRAGQIVQAGSPDDLINRPADPFVREFINAQRATADLLRPAESGADA